MTALCYATSPRRQLPASRRARQSPTSPMRSSRPQPSWRYKASASGQRARWMRMASSATRKRCPPSATSRSPASSATASARRVSSITTPSPAAIGEHAYGAGRGSTGLLVITLGTGVGVAALIHGRPVRGADGCHPEAGHITVSGPPAPCYCGLPTCWEQLASRTALHQLAAGEINELAGKARGGDPAASQVFDTYGERVGSRPDDAPDHLQARPGYHRRQRGPVCRPIRKRPSPKPQPRCKVYLHARTGHRRTR